MNKPKARTSTTAKVTLTIEVSDLGSWGPDCQLDQVYRQAREQAVHKVAKLLGNESVRLISDAKVVAITTNLEPGK
ncbi:MULTISPECIES: hypothetical protein [unclassified Marinobacter]|uniref:hypothetical protein n=1 Tax=unclassified Marinobacter TaxID=83889 RepID=UPI001929094F|nr:MULTISPECIES: hypothetical protein [unclassified Marinobacter]MBL3825145.1 hypothetical protein [Marinobacter sp. MC3]MBL3893651.1 hypothetical protein [Marinobacter sp. MW3]